MNRNYKQYEIPPMWDYCPNEEMMYIDNIFKPPVISLQGTDQYSVLPMGPTMVKTMMGSVSFYKCELYTNELEVIPVGPKYVGYLDPSNPKPSEGFEYQHYDGRIKPGRKLFVSPGFLSRYCLPCNRYDLGPGDYDKIKSKLYPKHKCETDLNHITEMLSGYANSHELYYIRLDDMMYALESIIQPTLPDQTVFFPEMEQYRLIHKPQVRPHDFPVVFTRQDAEVNHVELKQYDWTKAEEVYHVTVNEDDYLWAICLFSELHDMN